MHCCNSVSTCRHVFDALQAAQLNVSNVDLGSLFLSFLQFYSEPSHFDVTRHAIDVVVTSGFAQKHEVQVQRSTLSCLSACLSHFIVLLHMVLLQRSSMVFVLLQHMAACWTCRKIVFRFIIYYPF